MNTETLLLFAVIQVLYFAAFATLGYFITRPINWVNLEKAKKVSPKNYPYIVLLYPVLRESEETMQTTMLGLGRLDYPKDPFRVVAIPNEDDLETVSHLLLLADEFSFLEVMQVPPTSNQKWNIIWQAWNENTNATWWHEGVHQKVTKLPPKKTRQMIFAFYTLT